VDVIMENVFSRALSIAQDVNPGTGGSFPHRLVKFQDQLYFVGLDPDFGFELFNADSAQLLRDIYPTSVLDRTGVMAPSDFVELNGKLFFFANNGYGYRLWRTNGTAASTEPVASGADYFNPTELTVMQDKIYFSANSDEAGRELWVFEESADTVTMFHDIREGKESSNPHQLTVVGDDLFFVANDGTHGYEIWRTNNQEEQCAIVKDIYQEEKSSAPRHLTNVSGRLFFVAADGGQQPPVSHGTELWMSWRDGEAFTTKLVADINATSQLLGSSLARNLTWIHGSTLVFSACTPDTGQEMYLYDWQIDEAPRLYDLNPSEASSFPGNFVYLDGTLYFTASNSQNVEHLWAYPLDQSQSVQCLTANEQNPAPRDLTAVNQTLYFTASHNSLGRRLWATDGTKIGLVVGTAGGKSPHSPSNLFAGSEDRLYYCAFSADYGEELFQLVDQ
jgi:ELWxxDGT repeat protein